MKNKSERKNIKKIDRVNKKLEIVNERLIAIANSIETYILPTSAYFSEKCY